MIVTIHTNYGMHTVPDSVVEDIGEMQFRNVLRAYDGEYVTMREPDPEAPNSAAWAEYERKIEAEMKAKFESGVI
jgi:hypothetical protein